MSVLCAILRRDLRLSFTRGSEGMAGVFFFIAVASLFPFALGGMPDVLKLAAGGILWVAMLLASLLALDTIWHRDYDDGTFDLLLMNAPALQVVGAKMLSHWVVSGLTLLIAAGVVTQMFSVPADVACPLMLSLFFGSLYMSLLGGAGAALTAGSRRPGVLLVLLVVPLFVPMLILGVSGYEAALGGFGMRPYLLLQAALVLVFLPLMPLAAAAFLKSAVRA